MADAPARIWAFAWVMHPGHGQYQSEQHGSCTEYLRADIAAAREAELRAEVERLTQERDELKSDLHALQRTIVGDTGASAILESEKLRAEAARLRALLDEARALIESALGDLGEGYEACAVASLETTLAKIGGQ